MKTTMRSSILPALAGALAVASVAACGSSNSSGGGGAGGTSTSATTTTTSSTATTTTTTTTGTGGAGGAGAGGAGAGESLMCTSSGKNAFETYGLNGFVAVNKAIIANTTAEIEAHGSTNVGTSFSEIGSGNPPSTTDSFATFEGKLAAFLVWTYGGPTSITYTDGMTYDGVQDMIAAHTGLMITQAQYTYFLTNVVVPALTASGVTSADISSCFAPTLMNAGFVAQIVGH